MSGQIDPLFESHPFFADRRQKTAELLKAWQDAQFLAEIMSLEGEALDAKLRERGYDPEGLLQSFDKTMGLGARSR
jgi:hypothetical protein